MFPKTVKLIKIIFFLSAASLLIFSAVPAMAAVTIDNPSTIDNIQDLVTSIVEWILRVASGIVILFLIIGGIYYLTAAGDEQQMEKAKKIIKYCVIGLFVILISYSVVTTLNEIIFG